MGATESMTAHQSSSAFVMNTSGTWARAMVERVSRSMSDPYPDPLLLGLATGERTDTPDRLGSAPEVFP